MNRLHRFLLLLFVVGHFLLSFAYSALNPAGEAPDEADHWAFVVHLATERSLPVGPSVTQSKHPPLYHVVAALVSSLAEPGRSFLQPNPDVDFVQEAGWSPNFFVHTSEENEWQGEVLAFHLARLLSVVLSTLTVVANYGLVRTLLPKFPTVALVSSGVLAFLPEFAFIGGSISNDSAAALFGTLALWGAARHFHSGGEFRPGWWTPLALGFGLLSKSSTLAIWPVVGVAIVLGRVRDERHNFISVRLLQRIAAQWRGWVRTGLLVFLPALLIASPWLVRNGLLYGDPLGMALTRQTIDLRTTSWSWNDTVWLLRGWFYSFWGKFGGAGHIPMANWIYGLLLALTLLSFAGLIRVAFRRDKETIRWEMALLGLAIISTALVMWQYSLIALGTDQGRLLYPAVAPIVVLWVLGILDWFPKAQRRWGAIGLVVGMFLLGIYGLWGVLVPNFAPPPTVATAVWQADALEPPVDWDGLELVAFELAPQPLLYWRANAALTDDLRIGLRVVRADGTLVWEWHRSPGAGRYSTDRWQAGDVIADSYQIVWPGWAEPGNYRVEVGVQPFGRELIPPMQKGAIVNADGNPYFYLGEIVK